ncbi:MAG TPA: maleylpyruvate isomerase family mycothiol-dependent enzyme [Acidimicrobiia bacterium]
MSATGTSDASSLGQLIADLASEQLELQAVCASLSADEWLTPTAARGWDVRDTIAHLADTDEIAIDTIDDGPRSLNRFVTLFASSRDVTLWGVLRGRRRSGADVLAWWERTSTLECERLAGLAGTARVPWGIGMGRPAFVTARLMETWAHGLDVRNAVGVESVDTDRLRHVAFLATRALPYAFSYAGRAFPATPLRVELDLPSGATWTHGPADAPDRITGPAGEYCRVFVQRLSVRDAPGLTATGAAAREALVVARAFL